jgi:glycine/D-amino acid oxidase-like deaminating enzyme/nitrite reductase/ring-hydroxylating ferredoxin subunit
LGIKASYTEQLPLPFPIKAAVQFEGQAQFHPRKYLLAVAGKLAQAGGHIFENTRAIGIEGGQKCTVTLKNGRKITAAKVVIASHYPFSNVRGLYVLKIFPARTYALAIKARSKFPGGMYINVELPTRSLRSIPLDGGGELILIVGEEHKTGQGEDFNIHYKNLIDFAHQNFDVEEIQYRWSAQDYMTTDNIPIIGNITANEPNIYVATGFKKWGITTSAVSAMVLKDLIVKNQSPWAEVYNPARFTDLDTIWKSVEKNLNALKNGEGKSITIAERGMGAYKDDKGKIYLININCTHMGCQLKWNNAEKTWDCPCHGSRYSATGDVVDGPTFTPLEKIEII